MPPTGRSKSALSFFVRSDNDISRVRCALLAGSPADRRPTFPASLKLRVLGAIGSIEFRRCPSYPGGRLDDNWLFVGYS
jgi:hypothetical protein